jgi:4-hydroxybenzoate polyprenyltransferase
MVKIEHSVFALPFAYIGLFLAARGWPGFIDFVLLTLAMVAIRTWAMAINRIADLRFDRVNRRTQNRPLVTGEISIGQTWMLCLITASVFVCVCACLNMLCFQLSFVALGWSALYSLSKRFTSYTHFWLGSVLSLAPIGGWLAFEPHIHLIPVLFALGVLFWVAGFDILYSAQDYAIDQQHGLHSLPVRFGLPTAFILSTFSHINASLFFFLAGWAANLGLIYFFFWVIITLLLMIEHTIISVDRMDRITMAFFTLNGLIALILCFGVLGDILF